MGAGLRGAEPPGRAGAAPLAAFAARVPFSPLAAGPQGHGHGAAGLAGTERAPSREQSARKSREIGNRDALQEVGSYKISLGSCNIGKFQELTRREKGSVWFCRVGNFCLGLFLIVWGLFFPVLFISYLFVFFFCTEEGVKSNM